MGNEIELHQQNLAELEAMAGRANVLTPVISVEGDAISPVLISSIQLVRISAAENSGEVYNDFRYANASKGLFALSGLGLAKIAAAAGLQWDPAECRQVDRERRPSGHLYVRYRAGARIRQPNGETFLEIAEKEIDTEDVAEQLTETYARNVAAGRARGYGAADIPDRVKRDLLQLREHLAAHAETKAKNRVIRRLLSLRQVYSKTELERPFAVPRLLYRPEWAEEHEQGTRAASTMYGSGPALPDSSSTSRGSAAVEPTHEPEPPGQRPAEQPQAEEAGRSSEPAEPAGKPEAGGEPPVSGELSEPREDPQEQGGQYKGVRWSELAERDPDYLRGIAEEARTAKRRSLAQAWIDYKAGQATLA